MNTSVLRAAGQVALGGFLLTAGLGHLTTKRAEFQAQVPSWFPADKDTVVVASGYVEPALAAALLLGQPALIARVLAATRDRSRRIT